MQEIKQAADGTIIVINLMKRDDFDVNAEEEEIANIMIPLENLSKRE